MFVAKTIPEIRAELKKSTKKIAFIPTMGALHEGHLALVKKSRELAETVVVSIFVNKTQFNDSSDYDKYPRQVEKDLELLKKSGATHVFLPESSEIFQDDFAFKLLPVKLVDCLCGSSRPGHFDGVALIVAKLFNIIKPDIAIFGEKDFQQVAIIKKLVEDFNFDLEILSHEIIREESGLAMSSRNQRLSESAKIKAAEIFRVLNEIKNEVKKSPNEIEKILQQKQKELLNKGFEKIDYLEIREEKNLNLVTNLDYQKLSRIFIAVYLDGVRLIDNIRL
ncbi:MAG: pantoate--beta-alanine ligase [Pseudomonadota bacterium]